MLEVTRSFINLVNVEHADIHEVASYDEIKNYADTTEFLIIVTAGTIITDRDHLWNKIIKIDDTYGILANLLQYEGDDLPRLHEQFIIVRSDLVRDLDLTPGTIYDRTVTRSKKSMHGDYAPVEVYLDKSSKEQQVEWGGKLILKALKQGLRVRNFDNNWRYNANNPLPVRGFLYPKKSTDVFEQAHKEFKILPGLDDSQELYINAVLDYRKYNSVNIWSWDPTIQNYDTHTVAVPATGFLGEITAYYNNASKIIFYDINKNNLDFKQYLYNNWNGENYLEFALAYCNENNLNTEPNSQVDINDAEKFNKDTSSLIFNNWQKFKDMDKEFVHIDLIKEPQTLFNKLPKGSILHTSTMLQYNVYPFTSIMYEREEVDAVKDLIAVTNIHHYQPGNEKNELLL
jgi:hypothetical protein